MSYKKTAWVVYCLHPFCLQAYYILRRPNDRPSNYIQFHESPTGTTQGQPGASAPGNTIRFFSKSPQRGRRLRPRYACIRDTPTSAMACSDSPCVVPVGDFKTLALGPGAEAPGWPYVVPVGDFFSNEGNVAAMDAHFLPPWIYFLVPVPVPVLVPGSRFPVPTTATPVPSAATRCRGYIRASCDRC